MLEPLNRALSQIDDSAFLGVVLKSVALSALAFVLLGCGVWWAVVHASAAMPGWLASLLGGVTSVLLALLLFVPLATAIASSFTDSIAAAVERRHYPWLPPARPASLLAQIWDGVTLAGRVLLLQVVALVLAIVLPGPGLVLGWLITAWAIGRGLFVPVAMRRMTRRQAMAAYRARRWTVIAQGAAIALGATIPFVNLIAPVFGIAALTHVLHQPRDQRGLSLPAGL
jgi:uncharacterized protein involved in cysteine biosynthesis